jgi:hypothetical protein
MSMEELSTKSSEELKAMLTSREAWHALAEVQTAAASGPDVEREVLLHQAHALQTWPSAESPVIGLFCGDDLVPRITENNIRYLLHTLQHSEPEWKQPIFGFFQDIFQRSWNELLEHYKITNDDHSVKKLTRTLELKFRSKVWWHIHKQTIKSREAAAAAANGESAHDSSSSPVLPCNVPPFTFSNFDTVPPGVLLHLNGCTWAPTSAHWVTHSWGSRGSSCGGLNTIVVSASSLESHKLPAIMDSFHEFMCGLKNASPTPRLPPAHLPRSLPASSEFSSGYVESSEVFERCCACGELAAAHYVSKMALPALGYCRKVPVCHFCERLGAAAACELP